MWNWWNSTVSGEIHLHVNPNVAFLVEKAIKDRRGFLSKDGALVTKSGKQTGRAADDKYVVRNDASENIIDWDGKILPMTDEKFDELKNSMMKNLHLMKPETYIVEASAGADPEYSLGVNLVTTSPIHALFTRHIMRERSNSNPLGEFTILHDPHNEFDAFELGLRSGTAIAINFKTREIVIGGTAYCGEIKKAIFSVMNTLLPDKGVLPMHSGANIDQKGNVSVFFGLSGTGKTTLSTDTGMKMIGDDEHGLTSKGIFNFEGGCYAKTYQLSMESEPEIFKATNCFGSLVENVELDCESREIDFNSKTITENGRSTYPLKNLSTLESSGRGGIPKNFFFLSADAMGVLPLISKLSNEEAMYYFLLGYTAKVAGTEAGMKGISATFSHCFGAPFMMRRPADYGQLLKKLLSDHDIKVWLVNTGWSGGPYGVGERYNLKLTRECIRAVQRGEADQVKFTKEPVFNLSIPETLGSIEEKYLNPSSLWDSRENYLEAAQKLKTLFDEQYKKMTTRKEHAVYHQADAGL